MNRPVAVRRFPPFLPPFLLPVLLLWAAPASADEILFPAGSDWKYLDDGSDQGTAWREAAFDDSSWASGPAQLGYGDGDEVTVVGYGPNSSAKYITTYFRRSFTAADPGAYPLLFVRVLRDDGAVVYLNGVEVVRTNMPAGTITYLTHASSAIGGDAEDAFVEFAVEPTALVAGANVIAVEIHQSSGTSSDISFDLELAAVTDLDHPMAKAPYLTYGGVNTAMDVHWQLRWTAPCAIEWGEEGAFDAGAAGTAEFDGSHRHGRTISGLTPGVSYSYRVIAGADTLGGVFRAAPPADATDLRFVAYGDTRTHPEVHDQVAAAVLADGAGDPASRTFVLSVGDLTSDGDVDANWTGEFFDPARTNIRSLLGSRPFQSCIGNHEGSGDLFQAYFPYPYVADRYWSFDYGPAHFVVVDQYTPYGPGSAQLAWIDADLAATSKPWRFLVLHEPGWSAGDGHENEIAVQDYLQPICVDRHVSIVFGGHNHYYARAVVDGVQHVTTGGGGAPLHTPDPSYPYVVASAAAHHYCRIEITPAGLVFRAIEAGGSMIDSFVVADPTGVGAASPNTPLPAATLFPPAPNPFNPSVRISFELAAAGDADLTVHDAAGRLVARLLSGACEAGRLHVVWDGTNDAGRRVGPGIYFVRIQAAGETRTRKIALAP